jgi:hypothetical protein
MRIVGVSALLGRAQEFIGADPRWLDVLAEEKRGTLTLLKYVVPARHEFWQGHYLQWARISPLDDAKSLFILSYYRDSKKWEDLEVTGHLEECLQAIKDNVYGIFF